MVVVGGLVMGGGAAGGYGPGLIELILGDFPLEVVLRCYPAVGASATIRIKHHSAHTSPTSPISHGFYGGVREWC